MTSNATQNDSRFARLCSYCRPLFDEWDVLQPKEFTWLPHQDSENALRLSDCDVCRELLGGELTEFDLESLFSAHDISEVFNTEEYSRGLALLVKPSPRQSGGLLLALPTRVLSTTAKAAMDDFQFFITYMQYTVHDGM